MLVALSGGVDSAVAALLERERGAEVVAVTLKLWADRATDGERSCCSPEAVLRARRVAHDSLGIPHLTLDLEPEFRAGVVQPFIDGYAAGTTPNPCVLCNGEVRIDAMIALAERLGASTLVTGHYARIADDGEGPLLSRADDEAKDQTYMLSGLAPDSLARLRFPLASLAKPRVRELAASAELEVAGRAESQDLCFLAGQGKREFLRRHADLPDRPGEIVDADGNRLGTHRGHHNFTVGQRRGLGVSSPEPLYVLGTDAAGNRVTVGPRRELHRTSVRLRDARLHRDPSRVDSVRLRYHSPARRCRVESLAADGAATLALADPADSRGTRAGRLPDGRRPRRRPRDDRLEMSVRAGLLAGSRPPIWLGILTAAGAVAAITGLIYPVRGIAPAVSTGVLYLLAVLAISIVWGLWLGLATGLASALAFNFFHIPPTGAFTIADGENWVALVTFLIAAVVAGWLAELARTRAAEAEASAREAQENLDRLLEANREREALEAEAIEARALRRSDELKTALLRSVSHDLRSPLTAILAAGEALGSPAVSDEDRSALAETIGLEGSRLTRVVENLLDLSRLEAGAAEPRRDWTSIEEVAQIAVEQVAPEHGAKISIDPDAPLVRADGAQLERALVNVIENAARHSGGHPISVRGRQVGSKLVVRVVDRGPGIPDQDLERVFEAFQRTPAEADGHHGAGLGLAIARGFVEANDGHIFAESLPGQGTAFVIELPVEQPVEQPA